MPRRNPYQDDNGEPLAEIPRVLAERQAQGDRRPAPRDRSWDAQRSKATYDLPPEIIERIKQIAEELGREHARATVRVSDVAAALLAAGLDRYDAGTLEFDLQPVRFTLKAK
jgi:hypothetical protein